MQKTSMLAPFALAACMGVSMASVGAQQVTPAAAPAPAVEPAPGLAGSSASGASAGLTAPTGSMTGPDHGMPAGFDGGNGARFNGNPDLEATISLATAGGPVGQFSFETALASLIGPDAAAAEEAKLSKQYGAGAYLSFVLVQNFAVNDAMKLASAARVHFPTPTLSGGDLANRVVSLGLIDDTYYEGYQLDRLVSTSIDDQVLTDIDTQYGAPVDANFHKIADQAHYDIAHVVGATNVKLAPYH